MPATDLPGSGEHHEGASSPSDPNAGAASTSLIQSLSSSAQLGGSSGALPPDYPIPYVQGAVREGNGNCRQTGARHTKDEQLRPTIHPDVSDLGSPAAGPPSPGPSIVEEQISHPSSVHEVLEPIASAAPSSLEQMVPTDTGGPPSGPVLQNCSSHSSISSRTINGQPSPQLTGANGSNGHHLPPFGPSISEEQPSNNPSVQDGSGVNGQPNPQPKGANGSNGHQQPQDGGNESQIGNLAVQHQEPEPLQPPCQDFYRLHSLLYNTFLFPVYSDCTLHIHCASDVTDRPIQGHRLLLSGSPILEELMTKAARSVDGTSTLRLYRTDATFTIVGGQSDFLLHVDDRFVSWCGIFLAIHTLYARPLPHQTDFLPGYPNIQRFIGLLDIIASGSMLHIFPVVHSALYMLQAQKLISWDTLEMAVDFAIDGQDFTRGGSLDILLTLERCHTEEYQRGDRPTWAAAVLKLVVLFVLDNFPVNFDFDTAVPEFTRCKRLPESPLGILSSGIQTRGIKFGDLHDDVLSQLLLSVPFPVLKHILEHPRQALKQGWAVARLREYLIIPVLAEREKRRLEVFNSAVPDEERKKNELLWEAVGWREYTVPSPASPQIPTMMRTWVGFTKSKEGVDGGLIRDEGLV